MTMTQTAYILVEAEVGRSRNVLDSLRKARGVREAHVITGPYSLIAILEAPDPNTVARVIADRIHSIPGVLRTVSCLALVR